MATLPVGRANSYMPVVGGCTTIIDSGTATLSTGGSATVSTTTPLLGNIITLAQYSTIVGATTSQGAVFVSKNTNLTSFSVAARSGSVGKCRNSFFWTIQTKA